MAITVRKPPRKRRPPQAGSTNGRKHPVKAKLSRRSLISRAADAADRKKIGTSLDLTAFTAHHKSNSTSAAHWTTEE